MGELAGAAVLLALFAVNEARVARPLVPLSIFRVPDLGAADATQVIGLAGFYSAFFFVTLYMQDVLPTPGYYWTDLFPGLMIMGFGLGAVFVGVQTAANAGVPPSLAGLAGALVTASTQVGAALGLAIFSAVATART